MIGNFDLLLHSFNAGVDVLAVASRVHGIGTMAYQTRFIFIVDYDLLLILHILGI
jgi:hypothetical protein